jgi:16S rRNA processing protein RimM
VGPQPHSDRVCVAQIGAAHGIRGEVRLRAFTDDPMAISRYGPLESEDGRLMAITAMRPANGFVVARLAGVADRNAAEQLRNVRLYVRRERLPALTDADDFYHVDLIGLAVVDRDGHALGSVAAVHNFGAGDLIEVKPAHGPSVMLPFTKAVAPEVDLKARRLTIDLPTEIPPAGQGGGKPGPRKGEQ